eukprot:Nk52_evm25s2011 gene=Nk52_evmTU25s2011
MIDNAYSNYTISFLNRFCPFNRPVEGVVNIALSKEYLDKKLADEKFGFYDVLITCAVTEKLYDSSYTISKTKVREVYRNTHNTAGAGSTSFCYLEEGYEFPFSFYIPETMGQSFDLRRGYSIGEFIDHGIFCYIEATLLHSDGSHNNVRTKFIIQQPFFRTESPVAVIPPTISSMAKIRGSLGLFRQKRIFVTAQSDSSTYSIQDDKNAKVGLHVGFEDGGVVNKVTYVKMLIVQRVRKTTQSSKKTYAIFNARNIVGESKVKLKRDLMEVSDMDNSVELSVPFHKSRAIPQRAAWVNKAESHLLCASGTAVLTNITVHVEYEICIKVSFKDSGTVTLNPIPIKVTHADIEWESNTKTKRNPPKYCVTSLDGVVKDLFPTSSAARKFEPGLGGHEKKNDKNWAGPDPPSYMEVLAHPKRFSLKHT